MSTNYQKDQLHVVPKYQVTINSKLSERTKYIVAQVFFDDYKLLSELINVIWLICY